MRLAVSFVIEMDVDKQKRLDLIKKRLGEFKEYEKVTTAAVESKWSSIMTTEKLSQQKTQIEKVKVGYQKELDRYDAIIERLIQWIDDGEEQYQFALRAHKKNLDTLVNISSKRLDAEKNRFEKSLNTVVDEFESNHSNMLNEYNRHISEIRDVKSAIEHEYTQLKSDVDGKFRNEKDSLTMKSQESLSALRTHLMEEITTVVELQKEASDNFKNKSEGKMTQFNAMFEKHRRREKTMKKNETIIIKKAAEIAHWRRKIKNNERESKESNDRLRQEKENLSLHFRELKEIMARFRATEARKLAEISVSFEDAINTVKDKLVLAEKILKYSEMTRKLETEREQVLPFPKSVVETDPEIQRQMQQFKLQLKGDSKYVGESDLFDKFYRRFNKVLLEKLALQREKEGLLITNQKLKSMLKKQMAGNSITADFNNKPNTLFIVNQNTNAPMRVVEQDGIPIIDAGLTVGANRLQGY